MAIKIVNIELEFKFKSFLMIYKNMYIFATPNKLEMPKNRKLANAELPRLNVEEVVEAEKTPIVVILDNVRSLNNIGSMFGTSDAFLIEKIYLCGITATPPHQDIHKPALGATETVAWEYAENCVEVVEKLQAENVKVISIEQAENAIFLNDFQPESNTTYALVF